jgi:hypothetical protein
MKDLMPGDQLTQEIRVRVANAGSGTVALYLRAEDNGATNEDYDTLMNYQTEDGEGIQLSVQFDGEPLAAYTGEITNLAGESGQGVSLGTYTGADSEKTMTVTLTIPIEAGNEIRGLIANLGWVLTAEITPYMSSSDSSYDPTPGTELPDDETPLSELPDDETPLSELPDDEVPLSELPDDEVPLSELPDEEVPLAKLPQTGMLLWPIPLMAAGGLLLILVGWRSERRKEQETREK